MAAIHAGIHQICDFSLAPPSDPALSTGCASLRRREDVFRAAGILLPPTFNDKRADEPFDRYGTRNTPSSRPGRPSL
jgi:hypothetical protein